MIYSSIDQLTVQPTRNTFKEMSTLYYPGWSLMVSLPIFPKLNYPHQPLKEAPHSQSLHQWWAHPVKYVSVTISADLTWSQHIAQTCRKAKQHLGLIHRKLYQSPGQIRHQIYRTAVLPKLEYCASVWDSHHLKDIHVNTIENVQKFAGR